MKLLIDGYNLMFESTSVDVGLDGKNALRAARERLMHQLIDLIDDSMRVETMIVFDSKNAPSHLIDQFRQHGIQVVFARNWNSADELIQSEIRRHSVPKSLTVVTSDHAIRRKAIARGATVVDSAQWLDHAEDMRAFREVENANSQLSSIDSAESLWKNRVLSDADQSAWLKKFGS